MLFSIKKKKEHKRECFNIRIAKMAVDTAKRKRMSAKQGVLIMFTNIIVFSAITFAVVITLHCLKRKRNLNGSLHSPVAAEMYQHAAVVTDSPKCSEIGRDILQNKNGTAVDAAVATSFCLGLLAMHSTGIGGGGVMLIYKRGSKTMEAFDFIGSAPGQSRQDMFADEPELSRSGPLAVAVPGLVKGLHEAHKKYGKLRWKDLLQPTINMAETGYKMSLGMFQAAKAVEVDLRKDFGMRKLLFEDGNMVALGKTIVNKQLAETLKKIAEEPNDFYNGSLAKDIVKDIQEVGGIITLGDLANYKVNSQRVIFDQFGDSTLHTTGAPTGGPIVTHILNILKGYAFTRADLKDKKRAILTYHRIIEALKFGYAQKTKEGDPSFMDKANMRQWLRNMTSETYGSDFRLKITEDQTHNATYYGAETDIPTDHGSTHLIIVAKNGDAVSMTSTLSHWYGSSYRSLRTGILYNNEMDDFTTPEVSSKSGYPPAGLNFIKPNKRPVSSMAPLILTDKKGDVKIVLGASGGTKIITAVVQALVYMTWFGDDLGTAVVRPRIHHELFPNSVFQEVDVSLPKCVLKGLRKIGHDLLYLSGVAAVQGILVAKPGRIYAKCDPRKECRTAGY